MLRKRLFERFSPWASWHRFVISALRRLRQKDLEFQASVGYIVGPCPKQFFLRDLKNGAGPPGVCTGVDSAPHRGSACPGTPAVFGHFVLFLTFPGLEVGGGEGNPASSVTHGLQSWSRAGCPARVVDTSPEVSSGAVWTRRPRGFRAPPWN